MDESSRHPATQDVGGTTAGYRLVSAWGEPDVGANRYHEYASGGNLGWMRR
jgi:hypothetical protein